jgi:uncharacterized protein
MVRIKVVGLFVLVVLLTSCSESLNAKLNEAAGRGDTAEVKSLIAKGANVNSKDDCMTPLMKAVQNGNLETIKPLIIAGADPDLKSKCDGATASSYIQKVWLPKWDEMRPSPPIMRLLIQASLWKTAGYKPTEDDIQRVIGELEPQNASTPTPSNSELLEACSSGDKKTVIRLLNAGADIESKNEIGETPLVIAGRYYRLDIMSILIDRGANVNAKSELGTPLLYAAEFNYIDIVKKLIAKGADVNLADESGITPLQTAEGPHNKAIVQMLKKAGARE